MFSGVTGLVVTAGWTIAGAVGARALTQAVLGSKNTGPIGYGANAIAGLALSFGVRKFVKNSAAANAIMVGALVGILLRGLQDFTPFGQYASLSGMGDFQMATSFFSPRVLSNPRTGQVLLPGAVGQAAAAAAGAGKGMGAFYGRKGFYR